MPLDSIDVSLDLKIPFTGIGMKLNGKWKPSEAERRAAWEMYVELVTRISIAPLQEKEGLLREALASLHALFDITRKILRSHGPEVARAKRNEDELSFGFIAVAVLNYVLRPVLSKYHPLLLDHENDRKPGVSQLDHEIAWEHNKELRDVLEDVSKQLSHYANLLSKACDVPSLDLYQ